MRIPRNEKVITAFKNLVHAVQAYCRLERAEGKIVNGKTELKKLSRVQHRRTEMGNMQERLRAVERDWKF